MTSHKFRYFPVTLFFWIALISGEHQIFAQSQRFFMKTDRTQIAEGETFMLEVVIEDMDGKNLLLPDLTPFKIVQGPSTSSSITIINGKRSATQSYQYLLLATKKGKFTIAAATIKLGSRTLKSNTLIIEVEAAGINSPSLSVNSLSEAFIRLEAGNENVYPGQQIVLNLVLYTRLNIESYQMLNEPDFDGFYAQVANDIRDQPQKKSIKGKEYYTQIIRRWILFPQKTGIYTLGTVNCNLDIAVENGKSSFFFRDTRQETVVSNTVKLKVNPLPTPTPASFSGGVGNFTMTAKLQKSTVMTGEAINLVMQIEGDGDSRIVQAPGFRLPESVEKYSPSVIKEETFQRGNVIKMLKEFEYIFVPSKDTILTIKPEFTFIDVNSGDYKVIVAGPFTVNVVKGKSNNSNGIQSATIEKLSPMSDDMSLYDTQKEFFGSTLYFVLFFGIVFIIICTYFLKKYKQNKQKQKEMKEQQVSVVAMECLHKAETYKQSDNKALFYEEIAKATSGYLQQKYNIPNISADFEILIKNMEHNNIPTSLISIFTEIQKNCHLARFAGVYGDMENVYRKSTQWITKMEKIEYETIS